jgi:hypothetical protein
LEPIVHGNFWRELYEAALLELDPNKVQDRVKAAEQAIRSRALLDGDIDSDERIALEDALNALNVLKRGWH